MGNRGERRVKSNAEVERREETVGLEAREEDGPLKDDDARLAGRDGVGANDKLT